MKKILMSSFLLFAVAFAFAQKSKPAKAEIIEEIIIDTLPRAAGGTIRNQNQKVVTIRMKGDKKEEKMVVEIDGDKIKINGKDAADMKDVDININENRMNFNGRIMGAPRVITTKTRLLNGNKAILGIGMEKVESGVKISQVTEESGAAKAGLLAGDIITKIEDKDIVNEMDISNIVGNNKPGKEIAINYIRDGKKQKTKAILGERKMEDITGLNFENGLGRMREIEMQEMAEMPEMPEMFELKLDNQFQPDMKLFRGQGNVAEMPFFNRGPKLGLSLTETEKGEGLEINNLQENSVAAKAGLLKGDIITKINDSKLSSTTDVKKVIAENKDKPFTITYLRNGKEQKTDIKFPKKLKEISL